jgi:hypothetical protein
MKRVKVRGHRTWTENVSGVRVFTVWEWYCPNCHMGATPDRGWREA